MFKNEFRLECKCGQQLFKFYKDLEGGNTYLRCDDCGELIAVIPSWAIEWKKEDEHGVKASD